MRTRTYNRINVIIYFYRLRRCFAPKFYLIKNIFEISKIFAKVKNIIEKIFAKVKNRCEAPPSAIIEKIFYKN